MKAREVEQVIREYGMERGTVRILTALVEQVNQLEKNVTLMGQVQLQMTDTVANVVEGAGAMRRHMISTMQKHGMVSSEEIESDGLGPTDLIGRD